MQRPQLDALLTYAREGDRVVVRSMDRLAREYNISRETLYQYLKLGTKTPTMLSIGQIIAFYT